MTLLVLLYLCCSLLLLKLPTSVAIVEDCCSECEKNSRIANVILKEPSLIKERLIIACAMGCRLVHIDYMLTANNNISRCLSSCKEAYSQPLTQMACSAGCNSTTLQYPINETLIYTVSFITVVYETIMSPFDALWTGNNIAMVTIQNTEGKDTAGDNDQMVVYVAGNIGNQFTEDEDTDTTTSSEGASTIEIWLILQILCALLLVFSLLCCCCICSGEARSYSKQKKRDRDIINCEEDKAAYKTLTQPLATPITNYTVPVRVKQ